ncbi:uncharacterized protein LOC132612273 [Lycium barbarum]|uniref:uncharacterized protein LOC132612273 n=1 Tax=Lycium barbarum TaxID=112863 RepID=UPI00293EC640|nr:uncharacterized protein LOC132612273 [Lycium barbarum]
MINTISWNIRGVKSRGAFERLKFLSKIHKTHFIAVQEPFVHSSKIEQYKRRLAFEGCLGNCNGKIWFFWISGFNVTVVVDDEQQITVKVTNNTNDEVFYFTFVYAKSKHPLRTSLWESLRNCISMINGPWCINGDFNVIMSPDEKKGGKPHRMEKSWDFITCMDDCGMVDAGFTGLRFTWCNTRGKPHRIWKRLDRVFFNHQCHDPTP